MRIVFVRHGHPNYKDDCLTELGHLHAKAAADRPKISSIDKRMIYMNFLEIAENRQSCRKYDPTRAVEPEKLEAILNVARLSPSACNGQPYHITVCEGDTAKQVAQTLLSRVSDDVFYVILNTDVVFIAYSIVTFILDMVKPIKKD